MGITHLKGVGSILLLIREAWVQMSAWTSNILIEDFRVSVISYIAYFVYN